tara:strand:- start:1890 stop:5165 length:3276 start_codon:yes stop_codon:yes gene_type:complete
MATRPDIRDFDVESLLKSFAAAKRGSRKDPSYLKRLAPNLIKGVVGVYDQYQTEKLQDEIDQTNFDNTLELAKLNMNAAKKAKMYKETSGQYRDLASKGFNFDNNEINADTISDSNYAIAQRVFGDQAWRETTENFKTIPQELLTSYDDFKNLQSKYVGLQPEAKKNIESFYRAAIKDQANYVATGQSFNYDKFQAAAESLQAMDIDFDAADYGLLAKLDGRLRRKITMRDGAIDTFRSTYMSKPADAMDKALSVWRDSRNKDDLKVNLTMADLGYGAFITPEQLEFTAVFDPQTKEKMRQGMEQFFADSPDATAKEVQSHFNLLTFGSLNPNQTTIELGLSKLRKLNRINQSNLSDEEKQKLIDTEELRHSNALDIILDHPLADETQIQSIVRAKEVQTSSQARLKELNAKRDPNGQFGNEEDREEYQRVLDQNEIATVTLQYADMPNNEFTDRLKEKALKEMDFDSVKAEASFVKAAYIADPRNYNPDPNVPGSVQYSDNRTYFNILMNVPEEDVRSRALVGFASPLKAAPTSSSAEGMDHVSRFSSSLTIAIDNKSFFALDAVKKAELTEEDSSALLTSLGLAPGTDKGSVSLARNSTGIIKAAHMSNHLYEATRENLLGELPGVFRGYLPPRSLFENNLPELLIYSNAITRVGDKFIVDPSEITFQKVKNFYYSKYAEQSTENLFGVVDTQRGAGNNNTLTKKEAEEAITEVNERGDSQQQAEVQRIVDNAIIEDDPRMMGAMVVPKDVREERLETIGEGAKQFGSALIGVAATEEEQERARELTELINKKKVTPEPTSPKETSETTVLDTVINTLIPSAEAVVPETQQTSLLEGDNISRAVDRADARQRNLFSNKKEIPVTLSDGTSLMVDTTKPVVYLKNKFDANELTFDQGVEAYAKAIEAHNATLGLTSKANALDPIVDSLTFAALANPKEYNPRKFIRVASNKKESQNFKDIVFEIVNSEKAQEEINQYSLKVSDMTDQQKEKEFNRQAKRAKSIPVNSNNDYARNAIEYLKLQSIFGVENDRALPNLGKEEYGSTVNSKVSQYNDYLENYSPSMDSRLIQIYIQVANNLKSSNKNSLLASN